MIYGIGAVVMGVFVPIRIKTNEGFRHRMSLNVARGGVPLFAISFIIAVGLWPITAVPWTIRDAKEGQ